MIGKFVRTLSGIKTNECDISVNYTLNSAVDAFLSQYAPSEHKRIKKHLVIINNDDFIYIGYQCGGQMAFFRVDNDTTCYNFRTVPFWD